MVQQKAARSARSTITITMYMMISFREAPAPGAGSPVGGLKVTALLSLILVMVIVYDMAV